MLTQEIQDTVIVLVDGDGFQTMEVLGSVRWGVLKTPPGRVDFSLPKIVGRSEDTGIVSQVEPESVDICRVIPKAQEVDALGPSY